MLGFQPIVAPLRLRASTEVREGVDKEEGERGWDNEGGCGLRPRVRDEWVRREGVDMERGR